MFFLSMLVNSQKKILLNDSLVLTLNILIYIYMFSHIFHGSCNYSALFISLKFAFFFSSVFIIMCGFKQAFWLNLMTLCTCFKANLWFNACLKFLVLMTWMFYHASWLQAFQLSQFSFFQTKRIKNCEDHVTFQDIEDQLHKKKIHRHILHFSQTEMHFQTT